MNHLDKIISALYLAKSDNREKMLSDLILNVLYSINEKITINEITSFICDTFHLTPISYEVQECLNELIDNNQISLSENKYSLTSISKEIIHSSILKGEGEAEKRFTTFSVIANDVFDDVITEDEIKELWTIFNDYLLECFMVFGRKAIDIFMPYNETELSDDNNILKLACDKLKTDKFLNLFKKLVIEYPERLNEAELRYLTSLASRAEKFYSLGVEKEDYEKIKNLQIKDLIVLVDTNVLYSILSLRLHPENAAIFELLRLAKENQIDFRLVYLPKTYTELQKVKSYLDKLIPNESFKIPQIKAMLNSNKLDSFAKKYYESKLKDSSIPHPSEKIYYANDFLKSKGINIYNNRFNQLEEDEKYLNSKIAEYLDFQHYYNNLCDEKGYDFHLNKDDKKIEHDVFLREGVRILKSKYSDENELRFICLTLDRSLIHFDHYSLRNEFKGTHRIINPNFMLPSLFIKRIRPFIPISTNNYRKAFLSSLTAPNIEKEDDKETILVQKSMSYFKNLGIEDEKIILNCIKRELFLENFAKHEKDNTSEEFIKSEISNEIDKLKEEKEQLKAAIKEKDIKTNEIIKEKEIETQLKEKKVNEIEILSDSITRLEEEIKSIQFQNSLNEKNQQYELVFQQNLSKWQIDKETFITKNWNSEIPKLRMGALYFFLVLILTTFPVVIGFILKANEEYLKIFEDNGISKWYVYGALTLILILEIFGRSYLFDKSKVKNGWDWFLAFFSKRKYQEIMISKKQVYEEIYISENGKEPNKTLEKSINSQPL